MREVIRMGGEGSGLRAREDAMRAELVERWTAIAKWQAKQTTDAVLAELADRST